MIHNSGRCRDLERCMLDCTRWLDIRDYMARRQDSCIAVDRRGSEPARCRNSRIPYIRRCPGSPSYRQKLDKTDGRDRRLRDSRDCRSSSMKVRRGRRRIPSCTHHRIQSHMDHRRRTHHNVQCRIEDYMDHRHSLACTQGLHSSGHTPSGIHHRMDHPRGRDRSILAALSNTDRCYRSTGPCSRSMGRMRPDTPGSTGSSDTRTGHRPHEPS